MKTPNINSKKGFTIIEVVLVLAIAGLIFLMVFVALPNLQRTQRDTQRRDDVSRLSTALTQYVTNNNKLPASGEAGDAPMATPVEVDNTLSSATTEWKKFAYNYLLAAGQDTFQDPNGLPYQIAVNPCDKDNCAVNQENFAWYKNFQTDKPVMVISSNAKCGTEGALEYIKGTRKFAVSMLLESSGFYCVDNS